MHLAVLFRPGVHLEHLSEGGIGIGARTMAELADTHGDMVVERDELHVILEHVHNLLQVVRVPEREGKQHVIAVELRLFHRRHVDQLRQLQRNERHEVVIKVS